MNANPSDPAKSYWNLQAEQNQAAAAIDPADRKGYKNAYIAHCRNLALSSGLKGLASEARLLDFGCGSGTFLSWLKYWRPDISGFGADFSTAMLRVGLELDPELAGHVTSCDGQHLPFADASLDAICTAIALIYQREDSALLSIAREFRRTLAAGGLVASVEQVRHMTHHQTRHLKVQRAPEQIISVFAQAGFELLEWRPIRRGRFPLIYLIRYGLIPVRWHDVIARFEARLWRHFRVPQLDYADAYFLWRKID